MAVLPTSAYIENMVTLACATACVLGLYWLGAGLWSFGGLLMLFNLNYVRIVKPGQP